MYKSGRSLSAGPAGRRPLRDGDPLVGVGGFCRTSWRFASWRPAGVGQPGPDGPAQPLRDRQPPEVGPSGHRAPGHPEASGDHDFLFGITWFPFTRVR